VYAGVHSRGLEGPWKHADGYMVWVAEESEDGHPIIVKWIKEFPSQFIMGMKLNMYFGGQVGSGREYLGPLGMNWYPRTRFHGRLWRPSSGVGQTRQWPHPRYALTCLIMK
jgi:hypothetical protein